MSLSDGLKAVLKASGMSDAEIAAYEKSSSSSTSNTASKPAPNYPTRSIYQYSPEQLGAKIDEVAQSLLGRAITDADKQAKWYKNLNKTLNEMVAQGTVTSRKTVKNKKTGKMENVVIQKPEVSSEGLQQTITTALTAADPASLERKQNLEFANWAFKKMGGM